MKRAGSNTIINGLGVRISNVGAISREKAGHEHIISLSFGGCILHVSAKDLKDILDWYNAPDADAQNRETD